MAHHTDLDFVANGINAIYQKGRPTYSSVVNDLQPLLERLPAGYSIAVIGTTEFGLFGGGRLGVEVGSSVIYDGSGGKDALFSISGIAKSDTDLVDFAVEIHLIKGDLNAFTGPAGQVEGETPFRILGFNGVGVTIPGKTISDTAQQLFLEGDISGAFEHFDPGSGLHFIAKPADYDASGNYVGTPNGTLEASLTATSSQIVEQATNLIDRLNRYVLNTRDSDNKFFQDIDDFANEDPQGFMEQLFDLQCFPAGTSITMADGFAKAITAMNKKAFQTSFVQMRFVDAKQAGT